MPSLLRNCASKNSLKTFFVTIAQAKISLHKGMVVLFLLFKPLGPICLLHFCLLHDAEYAVV